MKNKILTSIARIILLSSVMTIFAATPALAQEISNLKYPADPASQQREGVAKGEILKFEFDHSDIFPGTRRTYSIYIPASYTPEKPACLFVNMDGIMFNAPTVFDNLIASGEMPVTIGVFVGPGTVMKNDTGVVRYNRSNEFDNTNDHFVRFLLEELLPDAETKHATDGRLIRFSKKAEDRSIAGASSGAICAFTAAWQRPDAFSRVFSAIGTFVGMRGADEYPTLIRKTEPKAIRVFLQDGDRDAWNPLFGNWYTSNLAMEAALNFSGYEVNHAWGHGGHEGIQADAVFPDAMRWLWKGWPQPVGAGPSANNMLAAILPGRESWVPVADLENIADGIDVNRNGEIIFSDIQGTVHSVDSLGSNKILVKNNTTNNSISAGPDGSLYVHTIKGGNIYRYDSMGKANRIASAIAAGGILAVGNGNLYVSDPRTGTAETGKLWLIDGVGKKRLVDSGPDIGRAIAVYPDKKMLLVNEERSHWILNYVIGDNGTLKYKQRLYWLHNTTNDDTSSVSAMVFDRLGNLYVATDAGVQVCDQNGRVRAILPLPAGRISAIAFGGSHFDTLFVVCGKKLFKRKLKVSGTPAWMSPVFPPSTGAG